MASSSTDAASSATAVTKAGAGGPSAALVAAGNAAEGLTGPQKALVLLLSLEEPLAAKIMAHMREEELRTLRRSTDGLREVDAATIVAVHREFAEMLRAGAPASLEGSEGYLRRLAGKAFGERKAGQVWDGDGSVSGLVATLGRLDKDGTKALLEPEHPQTVAVVLSQLPAERAGELLESMPPERQVDVVSRLARLSSIPESVMEELEDHFATEVELLGDSRKREVNGKTLVAAMLKNLKPEVSEGLLEELGNDDDELAEDIRQSLFTFEDLMGVDDRGLQMLLKEISTDQLVLSLKTASDPLKERIFGNISSRAAQMLREELEFMGPVKVTDVEAAQQAVVQTAMTLQKDGRIQIAGAGGGDLV
jgi:flagellar motor switch protein FliG